MKYDTDLYQWTIEQADALRRRAVNELDYDNLAEEIESVGRSERREIRSRLEILLIHLLKWRYQPEKQSDSWRAFVSEARQRIEAVLTDNPSLRGLNCCICPTPAPGRSRTCSGTISGRDVPAARAFARRRPSRRRRSAGQSTSPRTFAGGLAERLLGVTGVTGLRRQCIQFAMRTRGKGGASHGDRIQIALGTLIAERPPHRTGRAQLRHPAPTLDVGGEAYSLPHAVQAVGRALPARCPGRAALFRVLLGPRPWLHGLLGRLPGLVRPLHGYYGGV